MIKYALGICTVITIFSSMIYAESHESAAESQVLVEDTFTPVEPFSGKILGSRVRMRLHPNLDSHIISEVEKGEIFAVVGEQSDYYAIKPPKTTKAYIYRTFVLNDTVDADKVNVRLAADVDSPIVCQVNAGFRVKNPTLVEDNKWVEIDIPDQAYFWISKDYVDNIGRIDLIERFENRKHEVKERLKTAYLLSQAEMRKPFAEINIDATIENFERIIQEYSDFKDETNKAKDYIGVLQKLYAEKNIAYLEEKAALATRQLETIQSNQSASEIVEENIVLEEQEAEELAAVEETSKSTQDDVTVAFEDQLKYLTRVSQAPLKDNMKKWLETEDYYYVNWLEEHPQATREEFYQQEDLYSKTLTGTLEPFNHFVKSPPGDYIIRDEHHNPIGYLYSTHVDLQNHVGKSVSVKVVPRNSQSFAFQAYYVLSLD